VLEKLIFPLVFQEFATRNRKEKGQKSKEIHGALKAYFCLSVSYSHGS
jgi:hypothetical protein